MRIGCCLLLLLFFSPPLLGQNKNTKSGGMKNRTEPTSRRASQQNLADTTKNETSKTRVIGLAKRSKSVKKRIDELQQQTYLQTKPIESKKQSQAQIEELIKRRKLIRGKFDKQTVNTLNKISKKSTMFKKKWEAVVAELGQPQQSKEKWAEIEAGIFDNRDDWDWITAFDLVTSPVDEPTVQETEPSLDGDNSNRPKSGSPKPVIKVPSFNDLKKAFEQQKKPPSMSARRWIWLQDQYYRDLASLQSRIASAKRSIEERNAAELKSVDQAIAAAEATHRFLSSMGKKPNRDFRRHLAWRIHQARLWAQRALHDRLVAAENAANELVKNKMIGMHPMDPAETLRQMTRYMDTSSRPRAPDRNEFEETNLDGLPPLFPTDPKLSKSDLYDPDIHYGKLVESRIKRNQRKLEELTGKLRELDANTRKQDADELQRLEHLLWRNDLLDGKTNDRARRQLRGNQLKKKNQELEDSRNNRISESRKEIEKQISLVKGRLSKDYNVKEYKALDEAVPSGK